MLSGGGAVGVDGEHLEWGVAAHVVTVVAAAGVVTREPSVGLGLKLTDGGEPAPVERGGIAMGAPIASDVTPIVWPRPAGDLPEPPSVPLVLPGKFANPGAAPATG